MNAEADSVSPSVQERGCSAILAGFLRGGFDCWICGLGYIQAAALPTGEEMGVANLRLRNGKSQRGRSNARRLL
jgi:hypothetical protein